MDNAILSQIDERGVARLTLNRPAIHNAFDDSIIAALSAELRTLANHAEVRLLVLAANPYQRQKWTVLPFLERATFS